MATLVGSQKTLSGLVRSLIELDYDAVAAYRAAIERLGSAELKRAFGLFLSDHVRHATDLSGALEGLGEQPPTHADLKAVLTKGKMTVGALSNDRAVMLVMKTNEVDTNRAYERAVARNDIPDHLRFLFERAILDERRHRQYIDIWLSASTNEQLQRP
jgi:rubrerythrin